MVRKTVLKTKKNGKTKRNDRKKGPNKKRSAKKGGFSKYPPVGSSIERHTYFPETRKWVDGNVDNNVFTSPKSDPVLVPGYVDQPADYPFPDLRNVDPITKEPLLPDRLFTDPTSQNTGETYQFNEMTNHQPLENIFDSNNTNFPDNGIDADAFSQVGGGLKAGNNTIVGRISSLERKVAVLESKLNKNFEDELE